MKQNIYDKKEFQSEYDKMRFENKGYNANDLIEIPNFKKMLPDFKGKRVLDLGCGYGEISRYFVDNGANYCLGLDISNHMIEIANNENKSDNCEFKVMAMEDISSLNGKYDLIVSSLAFHYIKDYYKLVKDIYNLLNDGGYLVFSQEHPYMTSVINNGEIDKSHVTINGKFFLYVSDYNRIGLRKKKWNGEDVEKYHRNFTTIINELIKAGFIIEEILEPVASEEAIKRVEKYKYQYDRSYFLIIRVRKGK